MPEYTVEVHGEVRELYTVQAESVADAKDRWTEGDLFLSESSGCWVYDVTKDEEDEE